jgi:hypothetical protein
LERANLASCDLAGYRIRVRDFSRNPRGDLFVLFTAGAKPPMLGFSATDGAGGVYTMIGVSGPSQIGGPGGKGLTFDGEPLQGGWIVHCLGPESRGAVRLKFWLNGTGRVQTSDVSLTPMATPHALPDYSLYVSLQGLGTFEHDRLEAVATALMSDRQYGRAAAVFRQEIALVAKSGSDSAWLPEELGKCLTHLHKYREALEVLNRAEKVAEGMNPMQAQRIKEEILTTQHLAGGG